MEYKDTIFLPKTSFEMRANLSVKEPKILEDWDKENIFKKLREKSKGREKLYLYTCHTQPLQPYLPLPFFLYG